MVSEENPFKPWIHKLSIPHKITYTNFYLRVPIIIVPVHFCYLPFIVLLQSISQGILLWILLFYHIARNSSVLKNSLDQHMKDANANTTLPLFKL